MNSTHPAFAKSNLILLSLTYLFYFGQLGVLVPYLGVFLDGRGFSSVEIGELFALITLSRILGPNLWASLADKSGKGLKVLRIGSFLTVVTFCLIFFVDGFWLLTLSFALMMMFWTAVLPQIEVLTLNCVKSNPTHYSYIRLWGSIGFILLTVFAGKMIDVFSSEAPIYISIVVLFAIFVFSLLLKEPDVSKVDDGDNASIWGKMRSWVFVCFILSAILLQISFGPYYGFFALYARDLGYSGEQTGGFIALGVAAEVIIFIMAGKLITFFGIKWILILSILLTALRWYLLAIFAESLVLLLLSQILHAFSFALTHAASIQFIHRHFGQNFQSRGQAIYISIAFGLGGAIGNYAAGGFWDQGQGAELAFSFAAIAALFSAGILFLVPAKKM
ncbi:MAG: PPP family 3-phenylpropionic acid transporter [Paraglaciecola sp.]